MSGQAASDVAGPLPAKPAVAFAFCARHRSIPGSYGETPAAASLRATVSASDDTWCPSRQRPDPLTSDEFRATDHAQKLSFPAGCGPSQVRAEPSRDLGARVAPVERPAGNVRPGAHAG